MEKKRALLASLQDATDTESMIAREGLEREMDELLYREEIMWMQRSHIAWLREGDRNTKYFHRMACWRRKKNNIWKLKSRDRTWTSDTKEMENMSRGVFQTLYTRD
jgi:hypothetical protein